MARITRIEHARQRYAQVPAVDAEGNPRRTAVMVTKTVWEGDESKQVKVQRTDKRGNLTFMAVMVADRTKPLPMPECDRCSKTIEVGQPYKHISPKSGPFGGRTLVRCAECPDWQVWDYSSSLSARLAQIEHDAFSEVENAESPEDVQSALDGAADAIREIASEKRDSASNVEEGFGHATSASEELEQTADSLESWADEVAAAEIPELPEPESDGEDHWYVVNVDGSGDVFEDEPEGYESEEAAQAALDAMLADQATRPGIETPDKPEQFRVESREYVPDDPTDEQMDDWRSEVQDALSILSESPV